MSARPKDEGVLAPIAVTPKRASEITGIPERSIRDAMGKTLPVAVVNERVKVIVFDTLKRWVEGLESGSAAPSRSPTPSSARKMSPGDRADLIGRTSLRSRNRSIR